MLTNESVTNIAHIGWVTRVFLGASRCKHSDPFFKTQRVEYTVEYTYINTFFSKNIYKIH